MDMVTSKSAGMAFLRGYYVFLACGAGAAQLLWASEDTSVAALRFLKARTAGVRPTAFFSERHGAASVQAWALLPVMLM
jgi:hypothetical protein